MRKFILAVFFSLTLTAAADADPSTSWRSAKNAADDIIHEGNAHTFYCRCHYTSDEDSDGSGKITDTDICGYVAPDKHKHRAGRVEWEHVVPASLMPARQFPCWTEHDRNYCERNDAAAQVMIFDLHNLVPAIGQVNALRGNDRYAEIEGEVRNFGDCPIEDTRDSFEPGDNQRGDVARIWLYMSDRHGVEIPEAERAMFLRWHENDPVSDWEREKNRRVKAVQGNGNPYVEKAE
ncbi:endonuclease I family protein [Sneathiella glossodoripedis]|uniref:endonuclease I family protein n=1 Tax=Sneathiella glossodoripedis TaxID=418853 RepID=UPI0004719BAB|nr:endonuclease [Sneathiella glossodoripedis]